MGNDYDRAISARKRGDAALSTGEAAKALEYYQSSIKALVSFKAKARGPLKSAVEKGIKSLQAEIDQLEKSKRQEHRDIRRPEPKRGSSKKKKPTEISEECKEGQFQIIEPKRTFNDLGGMDTVKDELRALIELPLRFPEKFKKRGISPQTGILLYGPPGCGKTYLAECTGGEFDLPVILARSPEILDGSRVGNSEKNVAKLFACARSRVPSILMVDEIDSLLPKDKTGSNVTRQVEGVFLQELSGIASQESMQAIFLAATNYPWNLNPALIRPGRIDSIVYVPPPDEKARSAIFKIHLRRNELKGIDINQLVRMTAPRDGYKYASSGIENICDKAKRAAVKEEDKTGADDLPLEIAHFEIGLSTIRRSITPQMEQEYQEFTKKFASLKA